MKTKIQRKRLVEVFRSLNQLSVQKLPVKFGYAVAKNLRKTREEIQDSESTLSNFLRSPEFKEWEKRRIEICRKFADKDEKNAPKTNPNGTFVGLEGNKFFEQEIERIKEEEGFSETVNKHKKIVGELNELNNEEIEFEFHSIKFDDLPDDVSIPPSVIEPLIGNVIE